MNGRRELIYARNALRDEFFRRCMSILKQGGIKVLAADGHVGIAEDTSGTQYTLTMSRRRTQEDV